MCREVVSIGLASLITIIFSSLSSAQSIIQAHEIHIHENSSFIGRTITQMGTDEAKGIIQAGCLALGVECSQAAAEIQQGARLVDSFSSGSTEVITTADLLIHDYENSEEWYGLFSVPDGYEICTASGNINNAGLSGGSTFNVILLRNSFDQKLGRVANGLGFYAVVPKGRGHGEGIDMVLLVKAVPLGASAQDQCWPDKANPWLCTGQDCSRMPGASY